ncbi:hypothetical protein [Streptodolium elevatio]|uniref:Uncharacterized protein n=1 Tax=Streptodolium elevatio TaxID=3157996 RepID=A0ABV3DVU6_9ACTN
MHELQMIVRARGGKLAREESQYDLAVCTADSVQTMLYQLNQDIAEYVWRATGDDPAPTK